MQHGIRFRPPTGPLAPSVLWVLIHAFGPSHQPVHDASADDCLRNARRLGLLPRILSRHSREELAAELGDVVARDAARGLHQQIALGLAIKQTQQQIAAIARKIGISIGLLKFAALYTQGLVTPASRAACDLDILVDPPQARPLAAALTSNGYSCPERHVPPHQPFVVKSPAGVTVEIHVHVPYLRTMLNGPAAQLEGLKAAGLMSASIADEPTIFVPTREMLAAHIIAHGIAQHGFEPHTYPGWRMVTDLVALGFVEDPALHAAAHQWIHQDVSMTEVTAVADLITALQLGQADVTWNSDEGAGLLLRHLVYAALDQRYQARIALCRIGQTVREDGIGRVIREYATYALFLPEANLRRIYRNSHRSSLLLRLMRPADLAYRGLRRAVRTLPSWRK